MITVYCLTFPNGKKYVGVTSDYKRRMKQHAHEAKKERPNMVVSKAFKKYKTIHTRVLGYYETYELANLAEQYFIKEFETIKFGYNITTGGHGSSGYKRSSKTKEKLSKSLKGNPKLMGRTPWNKNTPFSDDIKEKIVKSLGGRSVLVFKDGIFIGSWLNLNKCSKDLDLYRGNITHCLRGKLKTTGGYTFKYED